MINFDISIHAPTRGATDIPGHIHILCGFQSTLPQGERQDTVVTNKPILVISIHAPTRGATLYNRMRIIIRPYFNPRSHKGSDDSQTFPSFRHLTISIHAPTRGATQYCANCACKALFQSTLPQGERQQFYTKFHICFISYLPILSLYHISTHSPLPTFNHFLYIFSGANRPGISCLLPFRTKTISGIL